MEEYLEKWKDFVYFLRLFSGYEYTPTAEFEPIEYQDVESPELMQLRNELRINEFVGTGSQWEQLVRLNHWLHTDIKHDGSSAFPHSPDSLSILHVCREEGRGVNCRLLATVLNEMCLSLGWKARFVTCLPMGEDFRDCHVVTTVYIDEWKKWVFVDPTWNAFVQDSTGTVLGLEELRNAFIAGEQLHVSDGINWNGEPGTAEEYLAYMAKNTFRFATNVRSEYGAEGKSLCKQYWLHPISYGPTNETREHRNGSRVIQRIYMSNPKFFWSVD